MKRRQYPSMFTRRHIESWALLLSRPAVLFYSLPWLMALLIAGTVAQKYLGLYDATKLYLTAPIIWLGGVIPLPGVPLILFVIFLNLVFKLFFKSPWRPENAGIIITHFGAAFLFLGMALTAGLSNEGYIALAEGESSTKISDYHRRELVFLQDGNDALRLPYQTLKTGMIVQNQSLPFSVEILDACRNCTMQMNDAADDDTPRHGLAEKVSLQALPLEKTEESNLSGVMIRIRGAAEQADGIYIAFEPVKNLPQITAKDGRVYSLALRRAETTLPFAVELLDVKRVLYPGTSMPQSYYSDLRVHDGDILWETRIEMNSPLRYKGYTFYQSGYTLAGETEVSTLAVVKNAGRAFPYIAGLLLGLGMLVHAVIRISAKSAGGKSNAS
ncbi:MAG: hypothetical protein D8M28_11935 [Proteobacteria bacterium]|nr:hypothetical protein [Pseudomonadota bacterium]